MAYEDANSVTLTGLVSGEPEYCEDDAGDPICRFYLSFFFRRRVAGGWDTFETEVLCISHRVTEWSKANITNNLRVCVQGKLVADDNGYLMVDLSYLKII